LREDNALVKRASQKAEENTCKSKDAHGDHRNSYPENTLLNENNQKMILKMKDFLLFSYGGGTASQRMRKPPPAVPRLPFPALIITAFYTFQFGLRGTYLVPRLMLDDGFMREKEVVF
jgi:hypothetical protein